MAQSVNIRIPEQVRDKLKKLSMKNGLTMGAMIAVMVEHRVTVEKIYPDNEKN